MLLEYDTRQYEIVTASSIGDGIGVELRDIGEETGQDVLFAFQFDVDGRIEFSCYRENIPFPLLEIFVREVRLRLGGDEPASP